MAVTLRDAIHRYEEAEEDCTRSISLNGKYIKAFYRRARARAKLGKLTDAIQGRKLFKIELYKHS